MAVPGAAFAADDVTPGIGQAVTFTDATTNTPTAWSWDFGDGAIAQTPSTYTLGTASTYAMLAGTTLTLSSFSAPSIVATGNIGETTLSGTPIFGTGSDKGTTGLATAKASVTALIAALKVEPGTAITAPTNLGSNNFGLGAGTFGPGVYTTAANLIIASGNPTITLDGDGDYVFISTAGTFTTCASATIVLTNGAQANRVYRVAATTITTGASNVLKGNFLAGTSITLGATQNIEGRLLATTALTANGTVTQVALPVYSTSIVQSPVHEYSTAGTYTVTLVATNASGADTEAKAAYITASAAAPEASFVGEPLSGATPLVVVFKDTSTNVPTSRAWTFGDGGTSTAQNPVHTYLTAGAKNVVLVATNAAGTDTATYTSYLTTTGSTHTTAEAAEVSARATTVSTNASYQTAADAYYAGTGTQAAMLTAKATADAAAKAEFDLGAINRKNELASSPTGVKAGDRHSVAERATLRGKGILA